MSGSLDIFHIIRDLSHEFYICFCVVSNSLNKGLSVFVSFVEVLFEIFQVDFESFDFSVF